jgi:hypothetical protein
MVLLNIYVEALNVTLRKLHADVGGLIAHRGMKPNPKGKNKPAKKG